MAEQPKKMRSLYADLLDSTPSSTISAAAVKYDASKSETSPPAPNQIKKTDAAFGYQPIKRPQAKTKAKPATGFAPKFPTSTGNNVTTSALSSTPVNNSQAQQEPSQTSAIDQWRGDPDENAYWAEQRRQERRAFQKEKKNRKKNKEQFQRQWSWDDVYDLEAPNNHLAFRGSDAHYDATSRWKSRLYRAANKKNRAQIDTTAQSRDPPPRKSALSFAPPSFDSNVAQPQASYDDDTYDEYNYSNNSRPEPEHGPDDVLPRASFAPAAESRAVTGDDADARRAHTSFAADTPSTPPVVPLPAIAALSTDVEMADSRTVTNVDTASAIADAKARGLEKLKAIQARLNATKPPTDSDPFSHPPPPPASDSDIDIPPPPPPPQEPAPTTISRAPVRYDQFTAPPPPDEPPPLPAESSKRPGQMGFAKRLMMKQGWKEGQGLGVNEDGVTTAIIAKAEKRKRRPDAEGGGWAQPANMGRIVGGKRRKITTMNDDDGNFGQPSVVVKLAGLLHGLDVDHELEQGTLMQDIGNRMETNGSINRIFVWRESLGGNNDVFVEFNVELSALRAVNSTDGELFEGNRVVARFFPEDRFHAGQYA